MMVNAPDGDFEAIAHLSNTLNDPDSKEAEPLLGIDWNKLWESPLEEIRTNLKIPVAVN
jgi:ubiquinone biosynthesis protein Coq4